MTKQHPPYWTSLICAVFSGVFFGCATPETQNRPEPQESRTTGQAAIPGASSHDWIPLAPEKRDEIEFTRIVVAQGNRWIDAAREGPAAELAASLSGYPFTEDFMLQLSAQVWPVDWLNLSGLGPAAPGSEALNVLLASARESHVLHIDFDFRFSENLSVLTVESRNTLYSLKTPGPVVVYRNGFAFRATAETQEETAEGARDFWLHQRAYRLFAAVQEGMVEIARLSAYDLQAYPDPDLAVETREVQNITGAFVREQFGRTWLRTADGTLHSLPAEDVGAPP